MSRKDDLVRRLKSYPKDFEIRELDSLMSKCNCQKGNRGNTSGSAIEYSHVPTRRTFNCHSPHPVRALKKYILKEAVAFLEDVGEI
jgi:hypothetical protein